MSFDHDKFQASKKHQLVVRSGGVMGGVAMPEDAAAELVVCDLDFQPHYENAHAQGADGRSPECRNPLKWTKRGVALKDVPL